MKPLTIKKGDGGFWYFDPATAHMRMGYRGTGPWMEFSEGDLFSIEAVIRSARLRLRDARLKPEMSKRR